MDALATVQHILNLPSWDQHAHVSELRAALRSLDAAAAQTLRVQAITALDEALASQPGAEPWLHWPDGPALETLLWMAQVRPDVCEGLPADLWRRRVYGHGVLYRGADHATRAALKAELDGLLDEALARFPALASADRSVRWGDPLLSPEIREQIGELAQSAGWRRLNVGLRMLAWTGDEATSVWFARRSAVLPWSAVFYRAADEYMSEGGWESGVTGRRRELTYPVAYQLRESNEVGGGAPRAVRILTPLEQQCRWCGRRLSALFDLDLTHKALAFLQLPGTRLRLALCEECSLWERIYFNVDLQGDVHWSDYSAPLGPPDTGTPGELLFSPPAYQLALGPRCASPYEVVAGDDVDATSQLGGMPGWVQDAEYVRCPACSKRMLFVGQILVEEITDLAIDGVLYALLCPACRVSTVTYQCT